jgi:hypothetical protein
VTQPILPTAQLTRFASSKDAPITPERIAALRENGDVLAAMFGELLTTTETLWEENARLQDGVDRQMSIVARKNAEIGKRDALLRDQHAVPEKIIDALRHAVGFAQRMRFLAIRVDLDVAQDLLTALGHGANPNEP